MTPLEMAGAAAAALAEPGTLGVTLTIPKGGMPKTFPRGELLNEMERNGRVERTYSFNPEKVLAWLTGSAGSASTSFSMSQITPEFSGSQRDDQRSSRSQRRPRQPTCRLLSDGTTCYAATNRSIKVSEYHKIQSIYKRDMTSKRKTLIEGDWTLPEFEYLAGNVWTFTEKVDGTNIRVTFKDGGITFGGRTEDAQIPAQLVGRLNERFLPLAAKLGEVFQDGAAVLYGEGYGAKIQKGGGNYRADQDFVLFDILVINAEYDTIKSCPRHRELINATLSDLTLLKGFVNPAITGTLRSKILNGQQNSGAKASSITKQSEAKKQESMRQGAATCEQNSESAQKNTNGCCLSKAGYAQSAQESTTETVGEGKSCHSPLTIATTLEESEGYCVPPAIQRFIKQSETSDGSTLPECTCKINDWWLQRADVHDVAQKLGLDVVPVIGEGTLHDAVAWAKRGIRSTWGDFEAEGIVARPKTELNTRSGHRLVAKIKCRDFAA